MINRVATDKLRLLDNGTVEKADYGYGMPTEVVLRDIMGVDNEQPKEVVETVSETYSAIADGDYNKAQQLLNELETMVPGHPELVRIRRVVERGARRK